MNSNTLSAYTLLHLPKEIITQVLSYLPPRDLIKTSLTCKVLNLFANQDCFWNEFLIKKFITPRKDLKPKVHYTNLIKRNKIDDIDCVFYREVIRFLPSFGDEQTQAFLKENKPIPAIQLKSIITKKISVKNLEDLIKQGLIKYDAIFIHTMLDHRADAVQVLNIFLKYEKKFDHLNCLKDVWEFKTREISQYIKISRALYLDKHSKEKIESKEFLEIIKTIDDYFIKFKSNHTNKIQKYYIELANKTEKTHSLKQTLAR